MAKFLSSKLLTIFSISLLFAVPIISSCSGSGSGGSDTGGPVDFGNISRTKIGSVNLGAFESKWVTPTVSASRSIMFTQGGGNVNEVVFDGTAPFSISGMYIGEQGYFEEIGGDIFYNDPALFYLVTWGADITHSIMMPPIFTFSGDYPSGDYEFRVSNSGGSEITVDIYLARKVDDNFSSGQFDLNFYIYQLGEPNPVIPNKAEAENVKRNMNEIFGQVGISIGNLNVEFVDDAEAIDEVMDEQGMLSFLERASRSTAGRNDKGINCFLMPFLAGNTLGMDGSIPGPGIIHGTPKSGLIAQMTELGFTLGDGYTQHETDQWVIAKILAHELGHYFGLFHTTERDGEYIPTLNDLPRCGPENDSNRDGFVTGPECRGKGADYLMFWTFDGGLVRSGDLQVRMSGQEGQQTNTFPAVN